MSIAHIAIADGKKDFTRIVKEVSDKGMDTVITKRGKPVAVLVSYNEYKDINRVRSYLKMLDLSRKLQSCPLSASELVKAGRRELEGNEDSD